MEAEFHHRRQVQFCETDMAAIAHFTNYFRYMEEAEHAFLSNCGLSVVMDDAKGKTGFPKLSATCDYKRPAQYEEMLDVRVRIRCDDGKTISYDCQINAGEEPRAVGQLRVAFCRFPVDRPPYPIPIPDHVLEAMFGQVVE